MLSAEEAGIEAGAKVSKGIALEAPSGRRYVTVNGGKASFTSAQIARAKKLNKGKAWLALSNLNDSGGAERAITLAKGDALPTEKRQRLKYNPPGWTNSEVNIEGKKKWFYNRSHLIAYCLSGLNDEERNLITGAVTMNAPTMSDIEVGVQKYLKRTDNGVLYEVTPVYKAGEIVPRGVQIRWASIDMGDPDNDTTEGNVYLYNANPGWDIDYESGTFAPAG
jgi:DNA-entry nuclease